MTAGVDSPQRRGGRGGSAEKNEESKGSLRAWFQHGGCFLGPEGAEEERERKRARVHRGYYGARGHGLTAGGCPVGPQAAEQARRRMERERPTVIQQLSAVG